MFIPLHLFVYHTFHEHFLAFLIVELKAIFKLRLGQSTLA